MRMAILGAGRIGPLHASTLLADERIDAVSITDVLDERAADVAAELGLEHVSSPDAAMDQADAVVIAAPTDDRPSLIRAAVGYGLPVFCEKPLATTRHGRERTSRHDAVCEHGPEPHGFIPGRTAPCPISLI